MKAEEFIKQYKTEKTKLAIMDMLLEYTDKGQMTLVDIDKFVNQWTERFLGLTKEINEQLLEMVQKNKGI